MSPFKCPLYIFLRVTWLFRSLSVLVNTARWNTSLNACIGLNFHFAFPSLLLIHHRNLKSPEPLMHSLQLCFLQTPGMFLMMLVMSCVTQRTCKIPLHCIERKFAIILTVALSLVFTSRRNFSVWYQYFFNLIVSPDIPTKDREFCRLGALQCARW